MRGLKLRLLALALAPGLAWAQQEVLVTPGQTTIYKAGIGAQYRPDFNAAMRAIKNDGDLGKGLALLAPIAAFCEALERPGTRAIAVAEEAEYDRYLAEHPGTPVDLVDMTCPMTFHAQAFALIERKGDPSDILRALDRAIAIAPYWAEPHNERGFVLAQAGRREEALASYRQAIALADASRSKEGAAVAWRGLGYTLVEMQQWQAAREAYDKSLVLDPGNRIALDELAFIDKHAPKATPSTEKTQPGDAR
jgi:tetratricopeptide (TPR) repeat protein